MFSVFIHIAGSRLKADIDSSSGSEATSGYSSDAPSIGDPLKVFGFPQLSSKYQGAVGKPKSIARFMSLGHHHGGVDGNYSDVLMLCL